MNKKMFFKVETLGSLVNLINDFDFVYSGGELSEEFADIISSTFTSDELSKNYTNIIWSIKNLKPIYQEDDPDFLAYIMVLQDKQSNFWVAQIREDFDYGVLYQTKKIRIVPSHLDYLRENDLNLPFYKPPKKFFEN